MDFDKKLRQQLQQESKQLEEQMAQQPGLFEMLGQAYSSKMKVWMYLVGAVALLLSALMLWSGYQFFFVVTDAGLAHKLHYGVLLLLSTMVQIALKMWSFHEMNRQSLLREIKRLQLMAERLEERDQDD
jgi:cation transport ATPase